MPLSHIEHYLILTENLEATRDWYVDVLGMTVGPAPNFPFPVYWLYIGDKDVVHIGQANASAQQRQYLGDPSTAGGKGTGALDHIAFRATGLPTMLEHLRARKIAFMERQVDDQGPQRHQGRAQLRRCGGHGHPRARDGQGSRLKSFRVS